MTDRCPYCRKPIDTFLSTRWKVQIKFERSSRRQTIVKPLMNTKSILNYNSVKWCKSHPVKPRHINKVHYYKSYCYNCYKETFCFKRLTNPRSVKYWR